MTHQFSEEQIEKIKQVLSMCRVRSYRDCVLAFCDMIEKNNQKFNKVKFLTDLLHLRKYRL